MMDGLEWFGWPYIILLVQPFLTRVDACIMCDSLLPSAGTHKNKFVLWVYHTTTTLQQDKAKKASRDQRCSMQILLRCSPGSTSIPLSIISARGNPQRQEGGYKYNTTLLCCGLIFHAINGGQTLTHDKRKMSMYFLDISFA